jgi:hypothetical protein
MQYKRYPAPITEAQHQAAVIRWSEQPSIRAKWPCLALLHHIPNGGARDEIEGAHLKAQGVRRGVPDLHLPVARGQYHSLYIEMKTATGQPSTEQKWWIEELNRQGHFATVCHGWASAVMVIEWYLSLTEGGGRGGNS